MIGKMYVPTDPQYRLLLEIIEYVEQEGRPPALRDLVRDGRCHSMVQLSIGALERKGCVRRGPRGYCRALAVTHWGRYQAGMPVDGGGA